MKNHRVLLTSIVALFILAILLGAYHLLRPNNTQKLPVTESNRVVKIDEEAKGVVFYEDGIFDRTELIFELNNTESVKLSITNLDSDPVTFILIQKPDNSNVPDEIEVNAKSSYLIDLDSKGDYRFTPKGKDEIITINVI